MDGTSMLQVKPSNNAIQYVIPAQIQLKIVLLVLAETILNFKLARNVQIFV
jgi:hypothetical protein